MIFKCCPWLAIGNYIILFFFFFLSLFLFFSLPSIPLSQFFYSFFLFFFLFSFLPPSLPFLFSILLLLPFFLKKKEGLILKCQKLVSESNSSLRNLTEQSAFYLQSWGAKNVGTVCIHIGVYNTFAEVLESTEVCSRCGEPLGRTGKGRRSKRSHYSFLTEGLVLHQDRNSASNLHIDLHFIPDGLQRAWLVCWEPEF